MLFARFFSAVCLLSLFGVAGLGSSDAKAQQIFRIVGADGRVTFSDKAPLDGGNSRSSAGPAVRLPAGSALSSLPFELRQVATRYPVTLYSAPGCAPCGTGRSMLSSRGVPFSEKTVTTNEDIAALQRISGGASLPFMTIGGQQIKGYSETEWSQFLDAAGYPKTSQLPTSYTQGPATPLVIAETPKAPAEAERVAAPAPAPDAAPPNPSGIRF